MTVSVESLKKKIEEDLTPLDVTAVIFYYFGETEFTTDYEKLNRAFSKEKKNEFLKEFRFLEGGAYPYSELLDSVISRLAISGLLGCKNPDYRKFFISKDQMDRIERGSLKKFTKEQVEELKKLSKKIFANLQG